jgi:multiple sugar transport system ATP-binding protein
MSVRENISFCLEQQKLPKAQIDERITRAAETLHITELLSRRPGQLSGGQRQRVAMGRAIVRNPKVFLFDEPLSNLDAKLRVQMRTEIKRLHQLLPTTTVYVTHDQVEAMTMADRVVVMNGGIIEQAGPPQELYHRPVSQFVAGFIGSPSMNFLNAKLERAGGGLVVVLDDGSRLAVPASRTAEYMSHTGKPVVFGIRPESISSLMPKPGFETIEATIDLVEPLGPETMIYFNIGPVSLCANVDPESEPRPGSRMPLSFNMNRMYLFDPVGGRSLSS